MQEQPNFEPQPEGAEETREQKIEKKRETIGQILNELGFERGSNIEAIADPDRFRKAQVGAIVARALDHLSSGDQDAFYDEVDEAIVYAENLGLETVVEKLESL